MPMIYDDLMRLFDYHSVDEEQKTRIAQIRMAAKNLAHAINSNAPDCADKSAAIRKVREAMMLANATICLEVRAPFGEVSDETQGVTGTPSRDV